MYSYLVEDTFVIEDVAVYFLGELEVMFVQNRAESKDGRPAKRLWFGHREKTTAPRGPIEEPWYSLTTSYQRKWINFALSMTYGFDTIYISSHLISSHLGRPSSCSVPELFHAHHRPPRAPTPASIADTHASSYTRSASVQSIVARLTPSRLLMTCSTAVRKVTPEVWTPELEQDLGRPAGDTVRVGGRRGHRDEKSD